jgi:hypothetical protein
MKGENEGRKLNRREMKERKMKILKIRDER